VTAQFLRFGLVGIAGLFVDTGVLWLARLGGMGNYDGRVVSFIAAATATYLLNRAFTFRHAGGGLRQWLVYLALMVVGFTFNYGAYVLCLALVPALRDFPYPAVAVGAVAGMGVNFLSARYLVFR
jgi:putative flippase GtrA